MALYMYTRTNSPLHINTGSYVYPGIISSLAPQSVITYNKHCLASILNSIVSSVLSHWVLPHYAVVSAPFEKLRSRKVWHKGLFGVSNIVDSCQYTMKVRCHENQRSIDDLTFLRQWQLGAGEDVGSELNQRHHKCEWGHGGIQRDTTSW